MPSIGMSVLEFCFSDGNLIIYVWKITVAALLFHPVYWLLSVVLLSSFPLSNQKSLHASFDTLLFDTIRSLRPWHQPIEVAEGRSRLNQHAFSPARSVAGRHPLSKPALEYGQPSPRVHPQ